MAAEIIYWDSDAFLGLINEEPGKIELALDVWNASEKGLLTIVTSALTVAEVIYAKRAGKVDPSKRQIVNDFFRRPNLVIEPLTRKISELARDVVWDHGIMPKDACHIATAAHHRIPVLHTFDGALLTKASVTIDAFTVGIIKPKAPRQLDIIDDQPPSDTPEEIAAVTAAQEPENDNKPLITKPQQPATTDPIKAEQKPAAGATGATGAATPINGSGAQTDVVNPTSTTAK